MKWIERAAWMLASLTLAFSACGGAGQNGPGSHDQPAPAAPGDGGGLAPNGPGSMPSDGTNSGNLPGNGPMGMSGSSSSGGGGAPPAAGTIPPAESPNAPPSGIAPH